MTEPLSLPDLPDGSPAGPNLELDAAFGELERAAQGKPESQYGNTIEAATPPDWQQTAALAQALLTRTRDLRVMTLFTIARLHLLGLPGFAEGLALIRQTLETTWQHVHPQLDPEDDNDPLYRANALQLLKDPARVLRPMRDTPLASLPRLRPVTWRDIAILNGTLEPEPGRERLSEAGIRDIFNRTDPARLAAVRSAVDNALSDVDAIAAVFDNRAKPGSGPDLKELIKLLHDIQKELARFEVVDAATAEVDAEVEPEPDVPERAVTRERGGGTIRSIAALNNREDALHALELAAAYFRTNEPSSPLPLLIDRAKRLAPLPFLDILRDLAPDGLPQAQTVAGVTGE